MQRRDFLKQLSLFSAGALLPQLPMKLLAQMSKKQFFLQIHVDAGWDTSLAMDPWTKSARPSDQEYFVEYREDELIPFANNFVGPAMAPLQKYFSRLSIINGVYMNSQDNGHPAMSTYAQSGNGQGSLGALAVEMDGRYLTSPFGVIANSSVYSSYHSPPIWPTRTVSANGITTSEPLYTDTVMTDIQRAQSSLLNYGSQVTVFNQLIQKLTSGATPSEIQVIAAAFYSKLSQSGFMQMSEVSLDTHSSHASNHLRGLSTVMTKLCSHLDILARIPHPDDPSSSILDSTTILITSEFTRTPGLNASQGKDHNPQANSALLIGPGVKQSFVGQAKLVESKHSTTGRSYLAGLPLDKVTEQAVERRQDTFIVRPENVLVTAMSSMGFDGSLISKNLAAARTIKSVLK